MVDGRAVGVATVPAVQFVLVRHAQPVRAFNPDGPADPGLSELGAWQADRLTAWLTHEPIDHIVTSPKRRAIDTVRGLLDRDDRPEGRPRPPHTVVHGLDEIDARSHHYFPTEELRSAGGEYWEQIMRQEWDALGWDSPAEFAARIDEAWATLRTDPPGDHVVVACHGGVIRRIAAHAMGVEGIGRFDVGYASITRIDVDGTGRASLMSLNETAHFDARRETYTTRIPGSPR